jgi:hypothetical protein
MPWEPGYFEQQAAEAAANVGQVAATVTQAVESVLPAAPASQDAVTQVQNTLDQVLSNLPPTKNQVTLDPTGQPVTVQTKVGPVTFWDRVKGAYKWLIAFVGFLLVLLNQLLVFTDVLPQNIANWINIAIAFLTSLSVFLKSNEHWIEGTGQSQPAPTAG